MTVDLAGCKKIIGEHVQYITTRNWKHSISKIVLDTWKKNAEHNNVFLAKLEGNNPADQ